MRRRSFTPRPFQDEPDMRSALRRARSLDAAWNARAWLRYGALLDDKLEAYAGGDPEPHGKEAHLYRAREFCAAFPDAERHITPYLDIFASVDGLRSFALARFTGSAMSLLDVPAAIQPAPSARRFDVTIWVFCKWRAGRIVMIRECMDQMLMARQLGRPPIQN